MAADEVSPRAYAPILSSGTVHTSGTCFSKGPVIIYGEGAGRGG